MTNIQLGCRQEQGRQDQGVRLSGNPIPELLSALDPGRSIPIENFPHCLAFTVTLSSETQYLMNAIDPFFGNDISLRAGRREIIFTFSDVSAMFLPPNGDAFTSNTNEVIHLQICTNSTGVPTLYVNCEAVETANVKVERFDTSSGAYIFLNDGPDAGSGAIYTVCHFAGSLLLTGSIV